MKTGATLPGYLPQSGIVDAAAHSISLLDLEGRVSPIALADVLWVAYVRDFNLGTPDPEDLSRRAFLARPRTEGLWMRLTLVGGDTLEGLAPLNVALVDGILADRGIYLIPPDIRSNTQRLFVPRTSFSDLLLLAVITTPSKTKRPVEAEPQQDLLFP